MPHTHHIDGNVQHLITINYQRMMAFEQAAYIAESKNLKSFYSERAAESEKYLRELCKALNVDEPAVLLQSCNDFLRNITTKKTTNRMLGFIISFEKMVLAWYKRAVTDVKTLPQDISEIVSRQYQAVDASQSALKLL